MDRLTKVSGERGVILVFSFGPHMVRDGVS